MAGCPRSAECVFYRTIEPSIVKRVRYANSYGYCRGGQHEACAIHTRLVGGVAVTPGMLPDGSMSDYLTEDRSVVHRFLVIEDSPIFAALASSTITSTFNGAQVVRATTYDEAAPELDDGMFSAVVCGFGLGGDRTVHDVRRHTSAPIVVLTGRLGAVDVPHGTKVVQKGAGSEALASALRSCLT